jgi:hypothetical protein
MPSQTTDLGVRGSTPLGRANLFNRLAEEIVARTDDLSAWCPQSRDRRNQAVGLVLDTFHILAQGTDLNSIWSIPKHRIFLVPVVDASLLDMVPVGEPPLPMLSGTG